MEDTELETTSAFTSVPLSSLFSLFLSVRQPCYLRDWEMQVHFKIHGQGKKNLNGDGLAIWYTKDRMQPGKRPLSAPQTHAQGALFKQLHCNEQLLPQSSGSKAKFTVN